MVKYRSLNEITYQSNPEIEQTLERLKNKFSNTDSGDSSSANSYSSEPEEPTTMALETRTLRELTAPNLNQQPLCITFPTLNEGNTFELKSGLIHLLPSFHGLRGEDPNKHLSEFHIVCTSMCPNGVTEEQIKLRAFPFSLKDTAKDWLFYLPSGSIDTWAAMKKCFLERYYPASISSSLKKQISNIEQGDDESLYEYWERFKKLCASCPYHGYTEQDLILYFYDGLAEHDRRMVNAACGGGIVNKTPSQARNLLSELAENSRHYNGRSSTRKIAAAESSSSLESQVAGLTSLVKDFLLNPRTQEVKVCGICTQQGHPTDSCPNLQEEQINALGFQSHQQKRYDPHSNTYNLGWRDHPNLRYGNPQTQHNQPFQQSFPNHQGQTSSSNMSTEDMIRALATNISTMQQSVAQFQETTKSSIQNLENQMSQISIAVSRLEAKDSGKLPSQTEQNPRQHVNAIMLRDEPTLKEVHEEEKQSENGVDPGEDFQPNEGEPTKTKSPPLSSYEPLPPFPEALKDTRKLKNDRDLYETFADSEVNIPLFKLIKSVPRYAKFLKELCTIKRKDKLKAKQEVKVSERVSAIFQRKLPEKCNDPGMFTIPCKIGDTLFPRALLDLGASINVIPYSLYKSLKLGPMHETGVVMQLADRSCTYPKGVVEDVLVQVENLVFPVDFYILEMEADNQTTPILLGRPFLKTAQTKIDVSNGSLTLEFDDQKVEFNIFDSTKKQFKDQSLCSLNVFEPQTPNVFVGKQAKETSLFKERIKQEKSILKEEAPKYESKSLVFEVITKKKSRPYWKRLKKKNETGDIHDPT
ncbi:unnamed protein product [Cuscuta epithymum]|uniref:Retrotransposon gag domain-containing protein n=1 Tax=Cuscuta epithymum TaxID=186058 RepID=A0AAV0FB32_9ASTE|nr:unnamed protein product [Cuscuta epithymum]